ncbi:hypothetical protein BOX15_Mlig010266g1, partial [Macrostomum lignano]
VTTAASVPHCYAALSSLRSLIDLLSTVCIFLMQGADRIQRVDSESDSPSTSQQEFLSAVATGDAKTLRRCVDNGASLCDTFDFYQMRGSPLQLACAFGQLASVKLLLSFRADPDPPSNLGESPLFLAAKNGHLQVVDHLITLQVDVNCPSVAGESPLFAAAQNGHQKVVQSLIRAQADVNLGNCDGESPVHIAVRNGHMTVIDTLIKAQADVSTQANDFCSPLHIASQIGHSQFVESLIRALANPDLQTQTGNSALHVAIDKGHLMVVRELLKARSDVNLKDNRFGSVPLHVATLYGNLPMVTELVKAHAAIDAQRNSGATALYIAAQTGNQRVLEFLIRAQADVNLQRVSGESPLYAASFNGHTRVVSSLLEAKADVSLQEKNDRYSPLYIALQNGHEDVGELLIKAQADVNLQSQFGLSPIYIAALNYSLKAVESLLGGMADVDLQSLDGDTAIHVASQNGHKEMVDALIRAQANVNLSSHNGETPIHCASHNGHAPVVGSLIKADARLNPQKYSGETPLQAAALNGHSEAVKLLIEAGANVNLQRAGGETALYIAANGGYNQIVDSLIKAHAIVDLQQVTGETPLNIASHNGHPKVVELLIKAQADVNLQKDDGCPPIFIASQNGYHEVVDLLIKAQADVNLQTNDGEAALHIASYKGHRRAVELLIEAQADVDILTSSGSSAYYFAIFSSHQDIVDLLATAQADIDTLLDERFKVIKVPNLVERRFVDEASLIDADGLSNLSNASDFDYGAMSDVEETVLKFVLRSKNSSQSEDSEEIDEPSVENAVPPSDAELSLQLHAKLSQSGFLDTRAALQTSVADVLQKILRKRLNNNGIYVVGSYSEGWGNNLKTVDGRTDIESDIDMMRLIAGKLYHPRGVCKCGGAVVQQEFSNGHIVCPGFASNPSEASYGSNLRPAVDHVVASRLCSYPAIAPLLPDRVSKSKIPKPVLRSLQQHIDAFDTSPCHVVHAASPGRGGHELRVSTSFLERLLLRSLNTVQGQMFIALKYLVKKVITHESGYNVKGVKPYHVKTITFRMLEKTSPEEWRPENLVNLTRQSMQMLADSVESSCTPDNIHGQVLSHFFLDDAALYLKGVDNKRASIESTLKNIADTLRTVIDQLPSLLMQFKNSLKPLDESARFYFHPFLILPIVMSNPVSDSSSIEYWEIPDVINSCLLRLSHGIVNASSLASLTELIARLPNCARSAREALKALACLKFGNRHAAAKVIGDCRGHEVSRGIDWPAERSLSEATPEAVWQHLLSCDSAWKFCLRFEQRPQLQFVTGALAECFPLQMGLNSVSFFYMNFDALLWALRLELGTESQNTAAEWIEDVAQREDADEQELLVAEKYCSPDTELKRELDEKIRQLQLRQLARPY